jgi:hypothetical protein
VTFGKVHVKVFHKDSKPGQPTRGSSGSTISFMPRTAGGKKGFGNNKGGGNRGGGKGGKKGGRARASNYF